MLLKQEVQVEVVEVIHLQQKQEQRVIHHQQVHHKVVQVVQELQGVQGVQEEVELLQ